MPDRMYLQCEEALFSEFPNATRKGYSRTGYGKDTTLDELVPGTAGHFSNPPFPEYARQAVATPKPTIFFDIGLRSLQAAAQLANLERCIYVRPVQPSDRSTPERTNGNSFRNDRRAVGVTFRETAGTSEATLWGSRD